MKAILKHFLFICLISKTIICGNYWSFPKSDGKVLRVESEITPIYTETIITHQPTSSTISKLSQDDLNKNFFNACKEFNIKEAKQWLKSGAAINGYVNDKNQTILLFLLDKFEFRNADDAKIVEFLVKYPHEEEDKKIDINAVDSKGYNALLYVIHNPPTHKDSNTLKQAKMDIIKYIFSRIDLDINSKYTAFDMTPFMFAIIEGCLPVVEKLIYYNTDKRLETSNGKTAEYCANGLAKSYENTPYAKNYLEIENLVKAYYLEGE